MTDDRVIELFEKNNFSLGDRLEVTEREGHFNFTVEEPWAGDTETGFGQECSVSMDAEQARELANWILARLGNEKEQGTNAAE